jgi:hypothetical protein
MPISLQRYRRYLQKLIEHSPQVTARKVQRRLRTKLRRAWERERGRHFLTHLSDRAFAAALDPRFAGIDEFLAHLSQRTTPRFFIDGNQRSALVDLLRRCAPEQEKLIVGAADRVCAHIFDLLGSGPIALGESIDWHTDFKSGYRWSPRQFYADVCPAPYPGGYDMKVPLELSRCQHYAWLGQVYWFTGDEKYAHEFVAQSTDWIRQNPPQLGVNWNCTMDVAIRAVNWLWSYHFFKDSPSLTDEFRLAFFKSLLAHGRHIRHNLEWSETLTSNHYLSNIAGLVYLGIVLPEFYEANEWRAFGLQELEKEMAKQVYPDGVDFEASTSYHRLATELFLSSTLLAQLNGHHFSELYRQRLERMLEFVMAIITPDGSVPLLGDNDNGRLHRLKVWGDEHGVGSSREWSDFRYLLAIGAVLFEREDFARAAGDHWEEASWFFGARALAYKNEVTTKSALAQQSTSGGANPEGGCRLHLQSQAFPVGGLYIMRHSDLYMVIDAGGNGQNGNGGHAHNDLLSLVLHAYRRPWLVDPGTYVYTADYQARNLFRSTAYHNTVQVDGLEINLYDDTLLFRLQTGTQPQMHTRHSGDDGDFLDVSHQGYARLAQPVIHRRQVFLDKEARLWIVRDALIGVGCHRLDWYWHYAPGIALTYADKRVVARAADGHALQLWLLTWDNAPVVVEEGWVSPGYGQRVAAPVLHLIQAAVHLPVMQTFALVPVAAAHPVDHQAMQRAYARFLARAER